DRALRRPGTGGRVRRARARGRGRPLSLPIASFKLHFEEEHVRALPAKNEEGGLFEGPGVDLRGDAAREAFAAAAPLLAWIESREPGARVRSLSMDLASGRVLATLAGGKRPRVVRIDSPASVELVDRAHAVLSYLGVATRDAIRKRNQKAPRA